MDGFFEILMLVIMIWVFSRGAKGKKRRKPRLPSDDAAKRGNEPAVDWDEAIGDVLEGLGLPRPDQESQRKPEPEPTTSRRERVPPPPVHASPRAELEARRRAELKARRTDELEARRTAESEAQRRAELDPSLEVRRAEAQRRAEVQRRRRRTSGHRGRDLQDVSAGPSQEERGAQRARSSDLAEIAEIAEAVAQRRSRYSEPVPSPRARKAKAARPDADAPEAAPAPHVASRPASGLKRLERLSELERAILYAEILGPPKALQADDQAGT